MNALIVGASQGIGLEFVKQLLQDSQITRIAATYRQADTATALLSLVKEHPDRLTGLCLDVTDESQVEAGLKQVQAEFGTLQLVVNCVGWLHEGALQPEKSLRQINAEQLMQYFQVNSIGAVLLAKHLQPLLPRDRRSVFATLSAKVGSIGDNHLGGWYGYRASKAALNMLMRTVAIEYGRRLPQAIVVLLHPGTTDTRLSQPFQQNVPPDKLFSVNRTVTQLLSVIRDLKPGDSGCFFSWDGQPLPW